MLMRTRSMRGFTLIEIMIGLVILGLLMALGLPSFFTFLQNTQVRNAADSIQNGLQVARAEAIRRNTLVSFTIAGPDSTWSVDVNDPALNIEQHSGSEGAANAQVAISPGSLPLIVAFDGLGKSNLAAKTTIAVTNPVGGSCGTGAGNMRCLNVAISVGGQVKMCDPQVTTAGDTRKC
ncbi:MAG TPA: GspH/FimT family pseudopilin [Burkholderiales bacterium]|nr:GspH/FimT family pseudopilin [Burkholderiales bacterium]